MIRGDIWWVDFGEPFGSEPAFRRPAVIVQNNDFNKSDMNTTIVIPLTTNLRLADFPGNYFINKNESKLSKDSVVVTPQITVIDKIRLLEHISKLSEYTMNKISDSLRLLLSMLFQVPYSPFPK